MGRISKTKAIAVVIAAFYIIVMRVPSVNQVDEERELAMDVLTKYRTGLSRGMEVRLADAIVRESRIYGLDPLLVLAVIKTESVFYNWARSSRGAAGLMQIREDTGQYLAGELGIKWEGEKTLYDPELNVKMGVYYLAVLLNTYEDKDTALAAYSSGPTLVTARLERGEDPPARYGDKVNSSYRNLKEGTY
ncbi:MAG: lytic transglycosylase domain-containing protein [Thermodesulfobacteriota bacterium]